MFKSFSRTYFSSIRSSLYPSIMVTLALGVVLCGAYPLAVYGIGAAFFNKQATGGIIQYRGINIGAQLIGQRFSKPEYFHGRPSSAGDKGYDAANSSGSNLGPTHAKLRDNVLANIQQFLLENPTEKKGQVPTELVTASGSGLDPHISPQAAYAQAARVAVARKVTLDKVQAIIAKISEGPQLGLFGESVVNVLRLNIELDQEFPLASSQNYSLTKNGS